MRKYRILTIVLFIILTVAVIGCDKDKNQKLNFLSDAESAINDGNYEKSKKFGNILSLNLISAKNIDVKYAPIDISNYNNIVLVFSTYGINTRENVKEYLRNNLDIMEELEKSIREYYNLC